MPRFDSTMIRFAQGKKSSYRPYVDHLEAFIKSMYCDLIANNSQHYFNFFLLECLENLAASDFIITGVPISHLSISALLMRQPVRQSMRAERFRGRIGTIRVIHE